MQGWKTREWKTRHQVAGVENAGVENEAPSSGAYSGFQVRWCEAKESGGRKSQSHRVIQKQSPGRESGGRRSSSSVIFYQHGSVASYACTGIAIAEMSVRLSVCLSTRLSVTLWYCIKTNKESVIHGYFTDGEREDSSFCKYPVHPKIRKGSP